MSTSMKLLTSGGFSSDVVRYLPNPQPFPALPLSKSLNFFLHPNVSSAPNNNFKVIPSGGILTEIYF